MTVNYFNDVENKPLDTQVSTLSGSTINNMAALSAGAGSDVFHADANGIWLGAEKFANAPFRVNMQGQAWFTVGSNSNFEKGYGPADAILKAGTAQVLSGDMSIGNANVKIDGANTRIMINDGANDRILIGYQLNGF